MTEREHRSEDETFIVRMESYEGPIDALLDLARSQRLDLEHIDMLKLVDQFESVLQRAIALRIEMAADWLVMAAWLAYLKSKNLLKTPKEAAEEPDAETLAFHLRRLGAVRGATASIAARRQVGVDWFAPGLHMHNSGDTRDGGSLHELLSSYNSALVRRNIALEPIEVFPLKPFDIASVAESIAILTRVISGRNWTNLLELVPPSADDARLRSNIASHLVAALEMTRDGKIAFDQPERSDPVMVKDAELP